jgi:hypothetical protein
LDLSNTISGSSATKPICCDGSYAPAPLHKHKQRGGNSARKEEARKSTARRSAAAHVNRAPREQEACVHAAAQVARGRKHASRATRFRGRGAAAHRGEAGCASPGPCSAMPRAGDMEPDATPRLRLGEEGGEEGGVVACGARRVVSEERWQQRKRMAARVAPAPLHAHAAAVRKRASSGVMGVPGRAPPGAASSPGVVGGDDILAGASGDAQVREDYARGCAAPPNARAPPAARTPKHGGSAWRPSGAAVRAGHGGVAGSGKP